MLPEPVSTRTSTDPSRVYRGVVFAALPVLLLIVVGVVLVLVRFWPWGAR